MDPRHLPAQHVAGARRRRTRRKCPAHHDRPTRKWKRPSCRSAGPTTAPTRPASTTSSSSCRCGRRSNGRHVVDRTGLAPLAYGAKRRAHQGRTGQGDERRADAQGRRASIGTSRRTSATTSWRRCPASRATTRSRSSAPTWTSWTAGRQGAGTSCERSTGIENVGVFSIKGQTNLEFRVDLEKCKKWGVSAADVNNVVQTALGGKAFATMIEGEKTFDITVRWPEWRRSSETSILDIPVDVTNNQVVLATGPSADAEPHAAAACLAAVEVRQPDRHQQPDHATRRGCGCATWCRRWATTASPTREGSFRAARRLDDLPRAGPAPDRRQVQRPRPRPGQRRGRGPGGDRAT